MTSAVSYGSMAEGPLLGKIQDLSDLELAVLLCLTAQEHCIINTEPGFLEDLVHELRLIASNVFGLTHAVINCSNHMSLDDFVNSILTEAVCMHPESPMRVRRDSYFLHGTRFRSLSRSPLPENFQDSKIANIVIAKNLDEAPRQIQIQALELIRARRISTHTSVQTAPKKFLLIAVMAGSEGPRLTKHLNEHIFISHFHDFEDGFPNLGDLDNDTDSISSVVRKKVIDDQIEAVTVPVLSASDIEALQRQGDEVAVTAELYRYIHNIVVFLRLHRAVEGGISPVATKHFEKLVKKLASLHGQKFVTPSLVALAVKKVYSHRIQIVKPGKERSMQWGSKLDAVVAALEDVGPDDVIEDVLSMVDVPL